MKGKKMNRELVRAIVVLVVLFAIALVAGWYGDPRYQG